MLHRHCFIGTRIGFALVAVFLLLVHICSRRCFPPLNHPDPPHAPLCCRSSLAVAGFTQREPPPPLLFLPSRELPLFLATSPSLSLVHPLGGGFGGLEDCGFGFGDWWLGLGSLVGLGLVAGVRWLGKVGDGFGVWVGVGKMVLKMEMKMGEEEEDGDEEEEE